MTVIYGAGEYGLFTYFKLREYGFEIDLFGDNNKDKQGYVIDNIICISYEAVLDMDLDTNIIVAIKNPKTIIANFKEKGFRNVYTKEEAIRLLLKRDYNNIKEPLCDLEKITAMKDLIQEGLYNSNGESEPYPILDKTEIDDIKKLVLEYKKRKE